MSSPRRKLSVPRLPACQSCYTRKVKCDSARPKCTSCQRSGTQCLTVSLDGSDPVSREYIYELEQSLQTLQNELAAGLPAVDSAPAPTPGSTGRSPLIGHEKPGDPSGSKGHASPPVPDGAGINFMSLLFNDSGWRERNWKLLQNLSRPSAIPETSLRPNSLPPPDVAREVFNSYLNGSHVQNPFLLRRDVQRLYHTVFSSGQSHRAHSSNLAQHDLFRTFMILAIGAVRMFRSGALPHHPYGYFLAAMQTLGRNVLSGGLESVQDLLLVVRFGIYHHIGTSIWELITLCMRMCIEQGLHKSSESTQKERVSLLQQQLQRRVFWECYMIDRYSSITLDRPPAIMDQEIHTGFPADANDEGIDAADASGAFRDLESFCVTAAQPVSGLNTEMTVFLFCLRLRKITSRIQEKFRQTGDPLLSRPLSLTMESVTASGRIYEDLEDLLLELEQWRQSGPVFPNEQSQYQSQEWFDLLFMRERLLLVRKAIDLVPKRNSMPPRDLLALCFEFAVGNIAVFCSLYEHQKITYTRSYFQMLFTAGLSVMCCVSGGSDHPAETKRTAADAIERAELTLKNMGRELPDAIHYVAIYEALRANVFGKFNCTNDLQHCRGDALPTTRDEVDQPVPDYSQVQPQHLYGQFQSVVAPEDSDANASLPHDLVTDASLPSLDIFGDSTFLDMEVGLGEYAYGDPMLLFSHIADD